MWVGRNIKSSIHLVDVVFSQENTDVTLAQCAALLKLHNVSYCRVESNSMGAMFSRNLQNLVPQCQILQAVATANKHTRILMDSVFINEYCYVKEESEREPMYEGALNQLGIYTKDGKAKHDDSPDALQGLVQFVRTMLSNYY